MRSRGGTGSRSRRKTRSRRITGSSNPGHEDDKASLLPELPRELIEEVLARLPAKSVVRFQLVCRLWQALLSRPDFITAHRNHSNRSGHPTRWLVSVSNRHLKTSKPYSLDSVFSNNPTTTATATAIASLDAVHESLRCLYRLHVPFLGTNDYLGCMVGACNGLVCLRHVVSFDTTVSISLWNPSTGLIKRTRTPSHRLLPSLIFPLHGFGYDESCDDYKVVILDLYSRRPRVILHVFSLKANSWSSRTTEPTFQRDLFPNCSVTMGVLHGGALHWKVKQFLLSFNLATEELRLMPLPFPRPYRGLLLGVLDGCLCILIIKSNFSLDLWVKKEYFVESSLTLLASLKCPPDVHLCSFYDVYILQCLMSTDVRFAIRLLQLKDNSLRRSVFRPIDKDRAVVIYEESLVSPYAYNSFTGGESSEVRRKKKKKKNKNKKRRRKGMEKR